MTDENKDIICDVVIVGCGVAGLYAALNLPSSMRVTLLSKGAVDECDSMLAQGGMCVLPEAADYDSFFEDTLCAGHGENRRESVDIMIRSSRTAANDLMALGVAFDRMEDGELAFTREGAHSRPRILFHADITGREITEKLLAAVRKLPNVQILEHVAMIDLLTCVGESGAKVCTGVRAVPVTEAGSTATIEELRAALEERDESGTGTANAGVRMDSGMGDSPSKMDGACPDSACPSSDFDHASAYAVRSAVAESGREILCAGEAFSIGASATLLATGGIGGVYLHSTNYPQLTGDGVFLANEYGVEQESLDYVQIHPTGLYSERPGRTFLISESCRGEGAILLNHAGERFCDELQPRDVVARAIQDEMRDEGTEYEWLSFAPVNPEDVCTHFANIRAHCLEAEGRDILQNPIPVVPTQHYFMGGIHVNRDGATDMPCLFAAGETACNGVHGKNRLASNSLLESLVWARRAAWAIATGTSLPVEDVGEPALDGAHRALATPGGVPLNIDVLVGSVSGEEDAPALCKGTAWHAKATVPEGGVSCDDASSEAIAGLCSQVAAPGSDASYADTTLQDDATRDDATPCIKEDA